MGAAAPASLGAGVLAGVNAAVVGLLLAALYQPVATSALHSAADVALRWWRWLRCCGGVCRPGRWWWPPR